MDYYELTPEEQDAVLDRMAAILMREQGGE